MEVPTGNDAKEKKLTAHIFKPQRYESEEVWLFIVHVEKPTHRPRAVSKEHEEERDGFFKYEQVLIRGWVDDCGQPGVQRNCYRGSLKYAREVWERTLGEKWTLVRCCRRSFPPLVHPEDCTLCTAGHRMYFAASGSRTRTDHELLEHNISVERVATSKSGITNTSLDGIR